MASSRRLRVETVRGEPYQIGARTLTPKARILSYRRARGTVKHRGVSGWGYGFARVTALAIIEETGVGERSIAITDGTLVALWGLLGSAVAFSLFFAALRWCERGKQEAPARPAKARASPAPTW
jgi:hypothetical protein